MRRPLAVFYTFYKMFSLRINYLVFDLVITTQPRLWFLDPRPSEINTFVVIGISVYVCLAGELSSPVTRCIGFTHNCILLSFYNSVYVRWVVKGRLLFCT